MSEYRDMAHDAGYADEEAMWVAQEAERLHREEVEREHYDECPASREAVQELNDTACPACGQPADCHRPEGS